MATVTINKKEYFSLLEDSEILKRLENGGVDNWDWFGESIHGDDNDETMDEWEERVRKEIFGE